MFLRCTHRKKNGKDHCYWSLSSGNIPLQVSMGVANSPSQQFLWLSSLPSAYGVFYDGATTNAPQRFYALVLTLPQ